MKCKLYKSKILGVIYKVDDTGLYELRKKSVKKGKKSNIVKEWVSILNANFDIAYKYLISIEGKEENLEAIDYERANIKP